MFNERVRCRYCQMPIRETDLTYVGAGRDKEGDPCFSYEFQCSSCRKFEVVVDTTHRFTQPDWWIELANWDDASPTTEQMTTDSRLARRTLPKIGPMVLGPWPLESVWIRGGLQGRCRPGNIPLRGRGGRCDRRIYPAGT